MVAAALGQTNEATGSALRTPPSPNSTASSHPPSLSGSGGEYLARGYHRLGPAKHREIKELITQSILSETSPELASRVMARCLKEDLTLRGVEVSR